MASHRHHCHCSCSCSFSCSCASSPSPHQPLTDPLIQAIAAAHLLQYPQPTHHHHHPYTPPFPNPQHQHQHQHQDHQKQEQEHKTHLLITSLLHRIDALEASLPKIIISAVDSDSGDSRLSSSSPSPPPPPLSLRDLAARTIQTHFRAFLARRSAALRSLKDLAVIRSSLNALKSSALSANTRLKSHALSLKSVDLLHRLHSIQGSDPMVRRGKRSISRELVRFLESLDRIPVTKQVEVASSKLMKKNVSFVEPSRKSSRVPVRAREPLSSEDVFDLDDDQIELVENLCRRVEDIGEELTVEVSDVNEEEQVLDKEESSQPKSNGGNKVKNAKKNYRVVSETSGDEFSFAPPLPVQMEPRRG